MGLTRFPPHTRHTEERTELTRRSEITVHSAITPCRWVYLRGRVRCIDLSTTTVAARSIIDVLKFVLNTIDGGDGDDDDVVRVPLTRPRYSIEVRLNIYIYRLGIYASPARAADVLRVCIFVCVQQSPGR